MQNIAADSADYLDMLVLVPRSLDFASYIETENYFVTENIYLCRTKELTHTIAHAQKTTLTSLAHNLANQKN